MYQFFITIYFIILGIAFYYQNIVFVITIITLGLLVIALYPQYKKIKKQNLKKAISNKTAKINVNRAYWWEIEELPGFNRVSAKKVIWIRRRNGNYSSKEDFYNKNAIENFQEIDELITI